MRRAFIASAVLHGAILALMFFGIPFFETERPEPEVIPVEIIPEAELADITTPKPEPKPEPEEKPEEEAPPPEPEPKPAPPPPPPPAEEAEAVPPLEEIKPEPKPKPEVKPEPKPEPRVTQQITPRTKPKAPSRFDTSRVAALLDKKDQPEPQPQTKTEKKLDLDELAKRLNPTTPAASQQQLATLEAMIKSQIYNCWDIPAGVKNAQNLRVRVRILLRQDGSLIGAPEVLNKERYSDADGAQFDVAARAAVNAIYRCTPLKLPRDRYDDWREVIQNFDPSQMLDVN